MFDNLVWSKILSYCNYESFTNLKLTCKQLYKLSKLEKTIYEWEKNNIKTAKYPNKIYQYFAHRNKRMLHGHFKHKVGYRWYRMVDDFMDGLPQKIFRDIEYKCGKRHGELVEYRYNDLGEQKKTVSEYKNNKIHGKHQKYDYGGKLRSLKFYKNGKRCCYNQFSFNCIGQVQFCFYDWSCKEHQKFVHEMNPLKCEKGPAYARPQLFKYKSSMYYYKSLYPSVML